MKIIEIPNGRLGNGIFRYLAALVFKLVYGGERMLFTQYREWVLKNNYNVNQIIVNDKDFIEWFKLYPHFDKIENVENIVVIFDGYFQIDNYKNFRSKILKYMRKNKNEIIYGTNLKGELIQNTVFELIETPLNIPKYKIVVHVRLEDFLLYNSIILPEDLYKIIKELIKCYPNEKICFLSNKMTKKIEFQYKEYFCTNFPQVIFESNDVITDFHIMKQAEVLVCSLSTLSWCAALLSEKIKKVYTPKNKTSDHQIFIKPIENTIVYDNRKCGETELNIFFHNT